MPRYKPIKSCLNKKYNGRFNEHDMRTISGWFEKQVQQTPNDVAVIFEGNTLTYQELNHRANFLANQLQRLTIFPDMQIALCMERSFDQIISIIAILKVGCAYVPLDPSQPISRLNTILQEGNISILIITSAQQSMFEHYQGHLLVSEPNTASYFNAAVEIQPNHLAYVIYTSGSTGVPKGVLIEQHSVINYQQWFVDYINASVGLRIDWSGNYVFDMVVSTSIVPLMLGMTIVMCSDDVKKHPREYLQYLNKNRIQVIKISPSYFKALVREVAEYAIDLPYLQTIILGGERLLTADCREWLEYFPAHVLFNEYGPTEATVAVTQQMICKDNIHLFDTDIPIGQPGSNMRCYILDEHNKPVLNGDIGELHIGGVCLSRGYLNRPDLTETKFIVSTFNKTEKLYKTGDLCRYLPNGVIEFMGRIDKQMKVRGYRIEPGEIETCLRLHPAVKDVNVVFNENMQLLVAYCILCQAEVAPSFTQIRTYLQQQLPDYMIPNAFVPITAFPLTANGKLDLDALPIPTLVGNENYTAPKTPLEKKLAAIWANELGIHLIGMNDNFFELGGHSLNAARIVSEINKQFNKNLSIKSFYQAETIYGLKPILKKTKSNPINEIKTLTSDKRMPLGDFQLFLWMLKTFEPNIRKLNIVSRKRWESVLDNNALNVAFDLLLKRHPILNYQVKTFYPGQSQKYHIDFELNEVNLAHYSMEEVEQLLIQSMTDMIAFDGWSKHSTQLIAKRFFLKDGSMELQLCLPHLISDDASMSIIWSDLALFYHSSLTEQSISHQVVPVKSFNEYVIHEQKMIESNFDQNLNFWEDYLQNAKLISFPSQYIVKKIQKKGLGYSTYQEISLNLLYELEQYCAVNHVGLNAVLCAAIALSLRNTLPVQSKAASMLMNIVKSTRNDKVWDETVGCFIRLDPIKVELCKDDTLLSLAQQIHQTIISNTLEMQTSTILKLASIGGEQGRKIWRHLIKTCINGYAKILRYFNINYKALPFLSQLSRFNRKNDFIVCINLRHNFTASTKNEELEWGGQKEKDIPMHQYDLENFDNVFDVSFLRDDNQETPYVVISSNLKPDFRQQIAKEIVDVLCEKEC